MQKSNKESANLFAKKARFFLVFIVSIFVSVLCKIDTFAMVEMGSKTAKQPITVTFELQEKDSQEPVEPEPVDPTPVEPEPTKPEPVDPEPVEPKPVEPEPTKPEPTDPNIPETGNTGLFTNNTSSNFDNKAINILASVIMALAIVFCVSVLLINKKREKSAREYLLKSKQVKKSFLFLPILLFATSISIFATNFLRAKAENADYPFSITLSSPSSVAFFAKQGETASKAISTTIESDNPTGYTLSFSADSQYLENESGDRISFSQSINNSDSTITLTINGEDTEKTLRQETIRSLAKSAQQQTALMIFTIIIICHLTQMTQSANQKFFLLLVSS